jgi:alkanesulfonate monooxygenase SsuD/methylene tetrahydromethanopterin reductase-like flavin-dependent oxidoreductase (luciferase family)
MRSSRNIQGVFFGLRFDFRNPASAETSMAERYAAALDMVEWADRLGAVTVAVSEHHGSDDGYLPSPLPMIAAMAARTQRVRFIVAALIAPFHDPLRLAEDLVVLDNLSGGRVDVILGAGYVASEFEMFGVPSSERGERLEETVETLRQAFTGQPFDFRGRTVHITPPPARPGGPGLILGGSSAVAARRAARLGVGFIPTGAEVWPAYCDEVIRLGGDDPGACPVADTTTVALVADVEQGWERLGPFLLHESNAYGAWQAASGVASPYRTMSGLDELRASGRYRLVTPEEFIDEMRAAPFPFQNFHPMCGGIPPELAWESLRLFEDAVLPAFASAT